MNIGVHQKKWGVLRTKRPRLNCNERIYQNLPASQRKRTMGAAPNSVCVGGRVSPEFLGLSSLQIPGVFMKRQRGAREIRS